MSSNGTLTHKWKDKGTKSHKPQFLPQINNKAKNAVYDTDMIG